MEKNLTQQLSLEDFNRKIMKKEDITLRPNPYSVYNCFLEHIINRDYAVLILKHLFYNIENTWSTINKRNKILEYLDKISKKDKEYLEFLEEVFITEFHYQVRLDALLLMSKSFPERAKDLFEYSLEREQDGLIPYSLRKFPSEKLLPLAEILDELLLEIFIVNKSILGYEYYYNFQKKSISYRGHSAYGHSFIQINTKKRFKRSTKIKDTSYDELIDLPIKHFTWSGHKLYHNIRKIYYKTDKEQTYPVHIVYEEKADTSILYFATTPNIIDLFKSLSERYSLTSQDFKFKIVKTQTTYLYLILEIKKIKLYMRERLSLYEVLSEDE